MMGNIMDMILPHWTPSGCHKSQRNVTLRNKASGLPCPLAASLLSTLFQRWPGCWERGSLHTGSSLLSPQGSHSGRMTTCQRLSKPILRGELLGPATVIFLQKTCLFLLHVCIRLKLELQSCGRVRICFGQDLGHSLLTSSIPRGSSTHVFLLKEFCSQTVRQNFSHILAALADPYWPLDQQSASIWKFC